MFEQEYEKISEFLSENFPFLVLKICNIFQYMCRRVFVMLSKEGYAYPKKDTRGPLPYWEDVQVDLSLCWLHRSYGRVLSSAGSFSIVSDLVQTVHPHL